jgi:hypothetical protein
MGGWLGFVDEDGIREVMPLDDFHEHDESPECWCQPFWDGVVLVHNSADGRERRERH